MARQWTRFGLIAAFGFLAAACGSCVRDRLQPPRADVAPYDTLAGDALWAVTPPRNETGTTAFDSQVVGDKVVAAAEEARGLRALPLNRTLTAMRALGLSGVQSPEDATALIEAMGVDGLVVPTVTAYDPYDPPALGLSLALFTAPPPEPDPMDDPLRWQMQPTDTTIIPASPFERQPTNTAGGLYDARNHDVLMRVREFSAGRTGPDQPRGWRIWLVRMDLYAEFAAHEAVAELLGREWVRLARLGAAERNREAGGDGPERVGARSAADARVGRSATAR